MSYWTEVDPPMSFIPEGWTYEEKRAFRHKCIPYLRDWIGYEKYAGKRVLCVGDGSGIDAVEFARAGAHVCVLDMSEKAIDLTKKHAKEAGVEITAWVGDATNIDLIHASEPRGIGFDPTAFFDAVYSFGVIHHIPKVAKAVAEISRVLKPGGEFLGMVYHKDSLLYAYSILRRAEREGITADEAMRLYSERNPGCPCSRAYTIGELRNLLFATYRFGSVEYNVNYNVIDLETKRKVPVDVSADLGWHLCFRAVKP